MVKKKKSSHRHEFQPQGFPIYNEKVKGKCKKCGKKMTGYYR